MRALFLAGTVLALASCSGGTSTTVSCLLLSPECVKADAELRLDIVNLPVGTTRVHATVADQVRETDHVVDRSVTFYFYDVPDQSDVSVHIDGTQGRRCELRGVVTGNGHAQTIRADENEDCGDDDDARWADGGIIQEDGGEPDGGDDHDAGCLGDACGEPDGGPDPDDGGR